MEKIIIVNEKDEIIGFKERGTLASGDIYRVTALWVENSKGQVLLAKRVLTKKKDPGLWGPAVAGTIDKGETYKSNIIKEAEEELGLKNINPELFIKNRDRVPHNHFTQWFKLIIDKPLDYFNIQKEEVEKIKWFDKNELLNLVDSDSLELIQSLKDFIKIIQND